MNDLDEVCLNLVLHTCDREVEQRGKVLSGTMIFKRIRRFKIQFLNPKLPPTPQIFLHSETDISRIDEYQKFGRKRMQDYNLISSSLATSQHF